MSKNDIRKSNLLAAVHVDPFIFKHYGLKGGSTLRPRMVAKEN